VIGGLAISATLLRKTDAVVNFIPLYDTGYVHDDLYLLAESDLDMISDVYRNGGSKE
jgi:hypothetical protein